jgi:hypothetical protein
VIPIGALSGTYCGISAWTAFADVYKEVTYASLKVMAIITMPGCAMVPVVILIFNIVTEGIADNYNSGNDNVWI